MQLNHYWLILNILTIFMSQFNRQIRTSGYPVQCASPRYRGSATHSPALWSNSGANQETRWCPRPRSTPPRTELTEERRETEVRTFHHLVWIVSEVNCPQCEWVKGVCDKALYCQSSNDCSDTFQNSLWPWLGNKEQPTNNVLTACFTLRTVIVPIAAGAVQMSRSD